MQYVNDDMDDVFRRAAQNYPLDTSGSDWNKVLKALQDDGQAAPVREKKGKGRFLWLLLLLPFSFICTGNLQPGKQEASLAQSDQRNAKFSPALKSNQQKPVQLSNTRSLESIIKSGATHADPNVASGDIAEEKNPVSYASKESKPESKDLTLVRPSSAKNKIRAGKRASGSETKTIQNLNADLETVNTIFSPELSLTKNLTPSAPPEVAGLPTKAETRPAIVPTAAHEINNQKRKKLYAGLMGGLDATVVKFQKVQAAGHDAGLVIGYEFSPKLALEGGVFYQEKSYYTNGRYYNTKNIYMPPNSTVAHVSAVCEMIEVPLYVKYNFNQAKKTSGYATFGMSSYFMKREDYSYAYQYSSGSIHVYDKTYKNSSTNILSAIHISGGLSRQLGKNGTLRIEPYLKIPVRSMGYGEMKLWSTGLHVGVTRRMF